MQNKRKQHTQMRCLSPNHCLYVFLVHLDALSHRLCCVITPMHQSPNDCSVIWRRVEFEMVYFSSFWIVTSALTALDKDSFGHIEENKVRGFDAEGFELVSLRSACVRVSLYVCLGFSELVSLWCGYIEKWGIAHHTYVTHACAYTLCR
jgi:hypothetical protein